MAKKKGLAKTVQRRKPKKNATHMVANPSGSAGLVEDFKTVYVPGFAGYVGNRFLARMAYHVARNRVPGAAHHIAALSTVVGAAASYYGTQKVESLEPYHGPVTLGAMIAALQTVAQTYIPGYGWVVSDIRPEQYDAGEEPDEDGAQATDGYFPSAARPRRNAASAPPPAADDDGAAGDLEDLDDLSDLDEDFGSF